MSQTTSLLVLLVVVNAQGLVPTQQDHSRFSEWARTHGKVYTADEHSRRLGVFLGNEQIVAQLNQRHQGSATFAMNHFGDLTAREFLSLMTGSRVPTDVAAPSVPNETVREARRVSGRRVVAAPDWVDWRVEGAVNEVRQQGGCGSCYAFATTAAIEGSCKIQTGTLWELSEQNVVDCSGCGGCRGGWGSTVYKWESAKGMNRAAEYPYKAQSQACAQTQNNYCRVAGWVQLPHGVEGWKLKSAVAQQPVDIALNANEAFQFYKSGILQADCPQGTGHEVLIVGYGVDNGVAYWLVRNSWGPGWGEQGYIRLARSDDAGDGICGLQNNAVMPVIASGATWALSATGDIPEGAIQGGYDPFVKGPLYVARSVIQNSLSPGKAFRGGPFYAGYGGSEYSNKAFEVLVGPAPRWVTVYPGYVLNGGRAGVDGGGQPLWVARVMYNGVMVIGKAGNHISGGAPHISWGGREVIVTGQPYEVLFV
eukprot:m51a1_g7907 putative cysteine proteinase (480) ;mRNA; f:164964-166650